MIKSFSYKVFYAFIKYLYTDEVNMKSEDAIGKLLSAVKASSVFWGRICTSVVNLAHASTPSTRLPHIMLHCYRICYFFIPDTFTDYAQLSSPLCPMCTQRLRDSSDHVGALSQSSSDTVDSEDVDSTSLGILSELWYKLLQESDVAILVLVGAILQLLYMWALFSIS